MALTEEEKKAIAELIAELRDEGSRYGTVRLDSESPEGLLITVTAVANLLDDLGCKPAFTLPAGGRRLSASAPYAIALCFSVGDAI